MVSFSLFERRLGELAPRLEQLLLEHLDATVGLIDVARA